MRQKARVQNASTYQKLATKIDIKIRVTTARFDIFNDIKRPVLLVSFDEMTTLTCTLKYDLHEVSKQTSNIKSRLTRIKKVWNLPQTRRQATPKFGI